MIAPAMVFAAMQFQPVGYVVSWNGSQHEPTMVALSIPLVRNSIKHLVLTTDVSLVLKPYILAGCPPDIIYHPVLAQNRLFPAIELYRR